MAILLLRGGSKLYVRETVDEVNHMLKTDDQFLMLHDRDKDLLINVFRGNILTIDSSE